MIENSGCSLKGVVRCIHEPTTQPGCVEVRMVSKLESRQCTHRHRATVSSATVSTRRRLVSTEERRVVPSGQLRDMAQVTCLDISDGRDGMHSHSVLVPRSSTSESVLPGHTGIFSATVFSTLRCNTEPGQNSPIPPSRSTLPQPCAVASGLHV